MSRIRRILAISREFPPHGWGGATPFTINLVHGLSALGVEVRLVTVSEASSLSKSGDVLVHRIQGPLAFSSLPNKADSVAIQVRLARAARELFPQGTAPDAVIPTDGLCFPPAISVARMYGVPVLTPVHQLYARLSPLWGGGLQGILDIEERYLRDSDCLLVPGAWFSSQVRAFVQTMGGNRPPIVPLVLGLGLHGLYTGSSLEQPIALPDTSVPRLAFLGRLVPEKGLSYLLRALTLVARHFPDVRLVVAGDGPLRVEMEALAASLHPQGRVRFLGQVAWPRCLELYRWANMLVVPSLDEPVGYVPLEALALGTLPIMTATGGLTETAELVPWECTFPLGPNGPNIEALAARILAGLALPPRHRAEIAQAARVACWRRHNPFVMACQVLQACEEAIRRRDGNAGAQSVS